jgi:putative sigma-54 modulation protein
MKTTIQAINFDIAEPLQKYIEKKTRRYEKLLPDAAEMAIRMTVIKRETNLNKETQIRILGAGAEMFVEKTFDTFEQGIDEGLEALDRQIEKQKDK